MAPSKDNSSPQPSRENTDEVEVKKARWIKRRLTGSFYGRIVMSSYETLRSSGTTVVCLSPWGDGSPIVLPCIRFRDLVIHAVVIGTGGVASLASPVLNHIGDLIESGFSDSSVVDVAVDMGEWFTADKLDEFNDKLISMANGIPLASNILATKDIKTITMTLKYKHTMTDASLGYFRSSLHKSQSLFSDIKERVNVYWTIEKGWFSPYLFASSRRPLIPRPMKPDIAFCWGPFLSGDYAIGLKLLEAVPKVFMFCNTSDPWNDPSSEKTGIFQTVKHLWKSSDDAADEEEDEDPVSNDTDHGEDLNFEDHNGEHVDIADDKQDGNHSDEEDTSPKPTGPKRRLMISVVGLKPHRGKKMWSTSKRPSQSVIRYVIMDGCPAIVLPVKQGCPLVAWHTMTLQRLYEVGVEEIKEHDAPPGAPKRQFTLDADAFESSDQAPGQKSPKWWRKTSKGDESNQLLQSPPIIEEELGQVIEATEKVDVPIIDQVPDKKLKSPDEVASPVEEESKGGEKAGGLLGRVSLPSSPAAAKKGAKGLFGKKAKQDSTDTSSTPNTPDAAVPQSPEPSTEVESRSSRGKKWVTQKSKSVSSMAASMKSSATAPSDKPWSISRKSSMASPETPATSDLMDSPKSLSQDLPQVGDYFSEVPGVINETEKESQGGTPMSPLEAWHRAKQWLSRKISQVSNSDKQPEATLSPLQKVEEVLFEYLSLHTDWDRMELPAAHKSAPDAGSPKASSTSEVTHPFEETTVEKIVEQSDFDNKATDDPVIPTIAATQDERKKAMLKAAVSALVAAAVKTQECEVVKREVNVRRTGIAMFRIP